ncbi:transglycosylase family protein [Allostreptomyces psammosilenae]|uniref:LysM domain-containing protein n=1 Tax=Allostreptomyces psammosilenae TaxID=1892865 RepID=A0A853A6D0_9ACTN|nr:transglycosylase family protein [Allostreptomyces psammosilenae]NYI06032.1 hypothetical protein [Allostreptomyces psammosilenae]
MLLSGGGKHRRPNQTDRLVRAAGVTGAGLTIPLLAAGGAYAADSTTWEKVAACETGGDWNSNEGDGFYGGLAFTQATWDHYGGGEYAERPDKATREEQIAVAERVLDIEGPAAWPACADSAGLTSLDLDLDLDLGLGDDAEAEAGDSDADQPPADSTDSGDGADAGSGDTADTDPSDRPDDAGDGAGDADATRPGGQGDGDAGSDGGARPDERPSADGSTPPATSDPSASPSPTAPDGPSATPSAPATDPTAGPSTSPSAGGQESTAPQTEQPSGRHAKPKAAARHAKPSLIRETLRNLPGGDARSDRGGDRADAVSDGADADAGDPYLIAAGDTLIGIADAYDVVGGWSALYELNRSVIGDDPNRIVPGQQLRLPNG